MQNINLYTIPVELLDHITSFMDQKDLCRFSQTSKYAYTFVVRSPIWRDLFHEKWPVVYDSLYKSLPAAQRFFRLYAVEYKATMNAVSDLDIDKIKLECKMLRKYNLFLSNSLCLGFPVGEFTTLQKIVKTLCTVGTIQSYVNFCDYLQKHSTTS